MARTGPHSHSHPANKTALIDTTTLAGRIQYAFGTIINAKLPEGVKGTKVARGMQMLWPHMSKDIAGIPPDQLERAAKFVDVMMQLCIGGAPEGMAFEEYLDGIFAGSIRILPGSASVIDEAVSA